ncbi:hypothetical protein [Micromonospora okii]|uniref:hypothetical protein n=1 Tax=Micromonospora okii TaxID=1182970 RepID=UPI001E4CE61C|nr:hypothetical protein [Micromonospora okii]
MFFNRRGKLADRIAHVEAAVREHDADAMTRAVPRVWQAAQQASVAELDAALPRCVALLPQLGLGAGGQFSVLCGALVELGARPDALVAPVADGLAAALTGALRFRDGWQRVRGDDELPDPDDPATVEGSIGVLSGAYDDERTATDAVQGWYAAGTWAMPAITLLQQSPAIRAAFPHRERLLDAGTALAGERPDLECVLGLLRVLDGERLLVLHRASGRGWRVTIDGVADNFQLHTLLAGALAGPAERGLIAGLTVEPSWVAVATDAPEERFGGTVVGSFNLVDGHGKWIWNEGAPADIPLLDDARVVVLDPPPYQRSWNNIRRFPLMTASLTVDAALTEDEATDWLARVADPA